MYTLIHVLYSSALMKDVKAAPVKEILRQIKDMKLEEKVREVFFYIIYF